jgi:hypothetical protein
MRISALERILLCVVASFICGCSTIAFAPEQLPLKLQSYQAQEFEGDKDTLFKAIVTVLQDLGCIIESADAATGYATGRAPGNVGGILAAGVVKYTVFIMDEGGKRSRIRITAVVSSSSALGANETAVVNPAFYERVFARIRESIFLRNGISPTSDNVKKKSAPAIEAKTKLRATPKKGNVRP